MHNIIFVYNARKKAILAENKLKTNDKDTMRLMKEATPGNAIFQMKKNLDILHHIRVNTINTEIQNS